MTPPTDNADNRESTPMTLSVMASKAIAYDPQRLSDADSAGWLADRILRGRYCWAGSLGWRRFDGRRWAKTADEHITEVAREALLARHATEARAAASASRLRELSGMLSANRIRAVVTLAKGILETEPDAFDRHPDLLNVGNGVIDLPTGELRPHDPGLLLTRVTEVDYDPDAHSADWSTALEALPSEVAHWIQVRFGQAITGHMTSDDALPVLQGGGSNGKSTILAAIRRALGEHAVTVPERVLLANPGDHPTDLTTLRGARLAVIEETPEGGHVSVKRLKDVLGSTEITARQMRQDNVTWHATHSLFLSTNYRPGINETDHGTWRRLLLVCFPYTYVAPGRPIDASHQRRGDPGLRERLAAGREGQHRTVLAWLVSGAERWYAEERVMPMVPAVVEGDTARWRGESDMIFGFIRDELVFDASAFVLSSELYAKFGAWLNERGSRPWSEKTFGSRFQGHEAVSRGRVDKARRRLPDPGLSRPVGIPRSNLAAQPWVWSGLRFRTDGDEHEEVQVLHEVGSVPSVPGRSGLTDEIRSSSHIESARHSRHDGCERALTHSVASALPQSRFVA